MNDDLVRAIREKRVIEFTYKNGSPRRAEPHDYGIRGGRERLLAYQLTGESTGGAVRGWKDLIVEDMHGLRLLDTTFGGSRGHETTRHRDWETLFARVG